MYALCKYQLCAAVGLPGKDEVPLLKNKRIKRQKLVCFQSLECHSAQTRVDEQQYVMGKHHQIHHSGLIYNFGHGPVVSFVILCHTL